MLLDSIHIKDIPLPGRILHDGRRIFMNQILNNPHPFWSRNFFLPRRVITPNRIHLPEDVHDELGRLEPGWISFLGILDLPERSVFNNS